MKNELEKRMKKVHILLWGALITWGISSICSHTAIVDGTVGRALVDFAQGLTCGIIIAVMIITSRIGAKICELKKESHS